MRYRAECTVNILEEYESEKQTKTIETFDVEAWSFEEMMETIHMHPVHTNPSENVFKVDITAVISMFENKPDPNRPQREALSITIHLTRESTEHRHTPQDLFAYSQKDQAVAQPCLVK